MLLSLRHVRFGDQGIKGVFSLVARKKQWCINGNPQQDLKDKGMIDSGCSRHMTGNKSYLTDYEEIDGGFVAFRGNSKGGKITRKGKIRTSKLDFEDVFFVKELKFNLFSVSQMCDKKNNVLFTDTECVVLSPDIKLTDESHVLLSRKHALSFMRPFGCPVTILNTIDHLDYEEINGGFVAFGGNSKGGKITRKGTKVCDDVGKTRMETIPGKDYILLPLWTQDPPFSSSSKDSPNVRFKPSGEVKKKDTEDPGNESGNPTEGKDSEVLSTEEPRINQEKVDNINITNNINTSSGGNNTNNVNAVSSTINVAGSKVNVVDPKTSIELLNDLNMPELEDIVYSDNDEDVGVEADMNNLDAFMPLFLAYASFKDSVVYQMDVKSAFLYAKIEEEVHVFQPPRFEDPNFPDRVYKVEKALYGLHQAPRACRRKIGFLSQDKYVTKILKKFGLSDVKIASTPMETQKPLLKDAGGEDVDEHLYRSMIGSLMYLTSLRPDIMFTVCGCARFQVNPKSSHLYAVKRIFRYLKGQPKLGLWYPKDSPFDLVAYIDSDYV
ncbi:putative reverse transcriptase, RNA-dependent DNA polymerase [Tanacetum coccineum]